MGLQEFSAGGVTYVPRITVTRNRNAYARVRGTEVLISIPERMRGRCAESVAMDLYSRMRKSVMRHPERYSAASRRPVSLRDGDSVVLMGRRFLISAARHGPPRGRLDGDVVRVSLPPGLGDAERDALSTRIASRVIGKALRPRLEARVRELDALHFGSGFGSARFSSAAQRWGSCTFRRGEAPRINISFRLLFMPHEYMDYVVVHELAHTVHRNHSKEFWRLVGIVVPDYRQIRRELGDKGDALMALPAPRQPGESGPA